MFAWETWSKAPTPSTGNKMGAKHSSQRVLRVAPSTDDAGRVAEAAGRATMHPQASSIKPDRSWTTPFDLQANNLEHLRKTPRTKASRTKAMRGQRAMASHRWNCQRGQRGQELPDLFRSWRLMAAPRSGRSKSRRWESVAQVCLAMCGFPDGSTVTLCSTVLPTRHRETRLDNPLGRMLPAGWKMELAHAHVQKLSPLFKQVALRIALLASGLLSRGSHPTLCMARRLPSTCRGNRTSALTSCESQSTRSKGIVPM